MNTDQALKLDVEAELRWDPRFKEDDIAVSVRQGTVTLSGFAHSYFERHEAEEAVKRVAGVAAIANDIEVRLPKLDERPDPEIARDIVAVLKVQLPLVCARIQPVVSQGRVSLDGELEWHFQRESVEVAVRRVPGVRSVMNRIKIRFRATPGEIKEAIGEAFKRSALLDAQKVTVEALDGRIVLRGSVRSWAEREEAERAAWAAPGVQTVDSQITVRA